MNVAGRMDFTARASGTLEQPVINANIHLRDLAFDHERVGDYVLEAVTQGSDLQVTGHSQFKDAELNIDGKVQLARGLADDDQASFQSSRMWIRYSTVI